MADILASALLLAAGFALLAGALVHLAVALGLAGACLWAVLESVDGWVRSSYIRIARMHDALVLMTALRRLRRRGALWSADLRKEDPHGPR